MDHSVSGAVEYIIMDRKIARGVGVAPALDVRGGVDIVPLLTPAEAGKTQNVLRDLAVFNKTSVHVHIFVKKILDRVDAVFDQISEIFDILHLYGLAVRRFLMGNSGVVDLINIAIFDYIIIASAVDLNAVSVACDTSTAAFGVVGIGAGIVLNGTADPSDLTAADVERHNVPAR